MARAVPPGLLHSCHSWDTPGAIRGVRLSKSFRSFLSSSALSLLGTVLGALLSVLYISQGVRRLGPEGYGAVGAAVSLANLFFLALNPLEAGLTLRVARFVGAGELAGLAHFARSAARGLSSAGVLLFIGWAGLVSLVGPSLKVGSQGTLLWLGAFCCAAFVACAPRATMRGREAFGALAVNIVLEGVVRTLLGLGLLRAGGGPTAMVAGYALGMGLSIAHGQVAGLRGLPTPATNQGAASLRHDLLLPLRVMSAPLVGLNVYAAAVANLDTLAAARFLTGREAGLYAGSASLARMVPIAVNPLLLVLFSRLATAHAAREQTGATLRIGGAVIVVGLGASLVVPMLGGELVLEGFLGEGFRAGQPVLVYQWATMCLLALQVLAAEAMLATSRLRAGWMFALPTLALVPALWLGRDSALHIAQAAFSVCAGMGSLTCLGMWWLRSKAVDGGILLR
jgi:O-antigen/teichoic acid export membrane protein